MPVFKSSLKQSFALFLKLKEERDHFLFFTSVMISASFSSDETPRERRQPSNELITCDDTWLLLKSLQIYSFVLFELLQEYAGIIFRT